MAKLKKKEYEYINITKLKKNTEIILETTKDIFTIKVINPEKQQITLKSAYKEIADLNVKAFVLGGKVNEEIQEEITYNCQVVMEIVHNKKRSTFTTGQVFYARVYTKDWSYELNWPNPHSANQ